MVGVAGCRDPKPAATQPLPEPPAAYPATVQPQASAKSSNGSALETQQAAAPDNVIWQHLGDWSGRGSLQTESFTGETGALRIKWETRAAAGSKDGTFLLTIHSAISGRPLQVAVDQRGPGADTAYVNEDPRVFFAVVDSTGIEWSFSVDEAVGTRVTGGR
jgi:hypothetical protein